MAEKSFFFTAVGGVPAYTADDFVRWIFNALFRGEGVLKGLDNGLAVTSDGAGNASIATGCASKSGHGYVNDTILSKALTLPAIGYTNINSIVVRVDTVPSPNLMHVVVLAGASVLIGNTPSAPSRVAGSDVYLADIQVTNTAGTYSYIVTDKREYVPILSNGQVGANWETALKSAGPNGVNWLTALASALGANWSDILATTMGSAWKVALTRALGTNWSTLLYTAMGTDWTTALTSALGANWASALPAALGTGWVAALADSFDASSGGSSGTPGDYIVPGCGAPSMTQVIADTYRALVTSTSYVATALALKSPVSGTLRVRHRLGTKNSGYTAYSKVYINGVAAGAEHSTTSLTGAEFYDDLTVSKGDVVVVYMKAQASSPGAIADSLALCSDGYGLRYI